jgi:hypothetical protein
MRVVFDPARGARPEGVRHDLVRAGASSDLDSAEIGIAGFEQ